jgi:hypothetical protein
MKSVRAHRAAARADFLGRLPLGCRSGPNVFGEMGNFLDTPIIEKETDVGEETTHTGLSYGVSAMQVLASSQNLVCCRGSTLARAHKIRTKTERHVTCVFASDRTVKSDGSCVTPCVCTLTPGMESADGG